MKYQLQQILPKTPGDNPFWRKCAYCGDDFFCYHQGQNYCPIKYGKPNHCRREQEKFAKNNKNKIIDSSLSTEISKESDIC